MAIGVSFATYKGVEHLRNPDVTVMPAKRGLPPWDAAKGMDEAGEKWRANVLTHYRHKDQGALSVFEVRGAGVVGLSVVGW